ncbi:MAG: hypothetical protein PHY93_18155 [Bacteriovorax sp.]|nr:hypothetical protein [Bacteriovorax sp.]
MKKFTMISLLFIMSFAHAQIRGSEGVGGGDLCEDRIKIVRDDLSEWIKKGGPSGLKLPANMTTASYSRAMLNQIKQAKIKCVSVGDQGYPVRIKGTAKVCRFDANESQITCDYNKFQSISESDQYILVHHEFAGLANIEIPNGADSNYSISNQITGYLVNQVVKKLSVISPLPIVKNVLEINAANLIDFSTEEDDSLDRKNCNLTITYRDTNMNFRTLKIEKAHGEDIDSLNDGLNGIHYFKNVQTYNNHCTEKVLLIDLKRSTVKFREYLTSCPHFY